MKICLLAAVALLAGCASTADVEIEAETEEDAITGGSIDRAHDAVVAIDVVGEGLCTGALVAPDRVVTARHCVSRTSDDLDCDPGGWRVYGNRDPSKLIIKTGVHRDVLAARGKRLIVPKAKGVCGHDIAVIVLDKAITNIKPVKIAAPPAVGKYVTAVGFGRQSQHGRNGTRMKRRSKILQLWDTELQIGEATCQGDSGGPALDSRGQVVAVLSRGTWPCDKDSAKNIFTRADAHPELFD